MIVSAAGKIWRRLAYEYYFLNLLMTMEQLKDKKENIDQIFLTLYGFLENYEKIYQQSKNKDKLDYLTVVSAILNAVLVSGISKGESFCNYVLNEYIHDQELRSYQIFAYILFYDYLYRTEQKKAKMKEISGIKGISKLQFYRDNIYGQLWFLWSAQSNLPRDSSICYLGKALAGLEGERGVSVVIDYFYRVQLDEEKQL